MPRIPSVSGLRASFEAKAINTETSRAEPTANDDMLPKKFKGSIDTVLATTTKAVPELTHDTASTTAAAHDTLPKSPVVAPAPVRSVGLQRPFWIGPPRLNRPHLPGVEAMKQSVTIEYSSPGAQPPVYVFTNLSEPQWSAVEMNSDKTGDGEYRFRKTFSVEEGEYQYKFRLGPGEWWALNESAPVVDDGAGNKNNLLEVKPPAMPLFLHQFAPAMTTEPTPQSASNATTETHSPTVTSKSIPMPPVPALSLPHAEPEVPTPVHEVARLMQHELPATITQSAKPSDKAQTQTPTTSLPAKLLIQSHDEHQTTTSAPAPLLKHETFFQRSTDVKDEQDAEPDHYSYNDDNDDDEQEDDGPPLLRHESFAPSSAEQTQAPLLRHESMAIGEHHDEPLQRLASAGSQYSSEDSVAPEADPNDHTLERFPTDQHGIFEHIRRVSTNTMDDNGVITRDDSRLRPALGDIAVSSFTSMPSVQEDDEDDEDDEELDELRDYEREKANRTGPITPPLTPKEIEKVVQTVLEVEKAEEIIEKAIEAKQAEVDGTDMTKAGARAALRRENTVFESEQSTVVPGTPKAVMTHPMSWLAFAGVAVALAVGVWKLR